MPRILIVEDHLDIAENIGDFLEANDHQVDFAYDGEMAISLAKQETFDAIIMDVNMPKLDGLNATKAIRQSANGNIPILMLTARDTLDDKLVGFEAGADDYILKPFEMAELIARLNAQLRKSDKNYTPQITLEPLTLNQQEQSVVANGILVPLKPACFKILLQLVKNHPNLVTKKELEFHLWGDLQPEKDLLRAHIYNLRKALTDYAPSVMVESKHGQGYKLIIDYVN